MKLKSAKNQIKAMIKDAKNGDAVKIAQRIFIHWELDKRPAIRLPYKD